jgi:hypothetical protein
MPERFSGRQSKRVRFYLWEEYGTKIQNIDDTMDRSPQPIPKPKETS